MKKLLFLLIVMSTAFLSCEKKKGCTDSMAKNYDMDAQVDCCCEYEKVVFFSRYPFYYYNGMQFSITAYPIKIYVDNAVVGTVTAYYPNGPGNSTLPGMVVHVPSGKRVEWFAKVEDGAGNFLVLGSGTIRASKQTWYQPIF